MTISQASRNIRYLLRRSEIDPESWPRELRRRTGWSQAEVASFLFGEDTQPYDLRRLAESFDLTEEELALSDLLSEASVDVFRENLDYLLEGAEHGTRRELAAAVGVSPNTVSRWCSGTVHPTADNTEQIAAFFGLPADINIQEEPIFLSTDPVSAFRQRQWLHSKIQELPKRDLIILFPALRRLFG